MIDTDSRALARGLPAIDFAGKGILLQATILAFRYRTHGGHARDLRKAANIACKAVPANRNRNGSRCMRYRACTPEIA